MAVSAVHLRDSVFFTAAWSTDQVILLQHLNQIKIMKMKMFSVLILLDAQGTVSALRHSWNQQEFFPSF